MNHITEIAQVVTAVGLLLTGMSSAMGLLQSWRNGRKIEEIHVATNSMKDKLVQVTGEAKYAEGLKHGEEYAKRSDIV